MDSNETSVAVSGEKKRWSLAEATDTIDKSGITIGRDKGGKGWEIKIPGESIIKGFNLPPPGEVFNFGVWGEERVCVSHKTDIEGANVSFGGGGAWQLLERSLRAGYLASKAEGAFPLDREGGYGDQQLENFVSENGFLVEQVAGDRLSAKEIKISFPGFSGSEERGQDVITFKNKGGRVEVEWHQGGERVGASSVGALKALLGDTFLKGKEML